MTLVCFRSSRALHCLTVSRNVFIGHPKCKLCCYQRIVQSALLFINKIWKISHDFFSRNSVSFITTKSTGIAGPLSELHRRGLCHGPSFPNELAVAHLSCGELPGEGFYLLYRYHPTYQLDFSTVSACLPYQRAWKEMVHVCVQVWMCVSIRRRVYGHMK